MPDTVLERQYAGPFTLAGGLRQNVDALDLKPNEASYSLNWQHRAGKLSPRTVLRTLSGFTSVTNRTAPFNGAGYFEFDNGNRYVAAVNHVSGTGRIWVGSGGTWSKISTDADMTAGGTSNPWDICFGVDTAMGAHGTAFFANGANEVMFWDATNCHKLSSSTGYVGPGGPYVAKYCCIFEGRLVLANMIESGTTHILRARVSKVNNFNAFDTTDGAQVVDHGDTPGAITGVKVMGNRLLVLKEDSIVVGQSTQDATTPIVYPLRINTGCLIGSSFQNITPWLGVFLGPDNVYVLTQGDVKPVGDPIKTDLFSRLDYSRLNEVCSHTERAKGLYRLFIPPKNESGTYAYVYNFIDQLWFMEYWSTGVWGATNTAGLDGTLISALGSALSTYTVPISSWGSNLGETIPVLSSAYSSSDYRLNSLSEFAYDEANSGYISISPEWRSKAVSLNEEGYATLTGIVIEYRSSNAFLLTVGVSTDRGMTWDDAVLSVSASDAGGTGVSSVRVNFRTTGRLHMLRLKADPIKIRTTDPSIITFPVELLNVRLSFLKRFAER